MEIEQAFTTEAITAADTNVTDAEETELRAMFARIDSEQYSEEEMAMLFFVAGRTHQSDQLDWDSQIPVVMSPEGVSLYIAYLVSLIRATPPKE